MLAADIEKAELTRDRMAELSRADAADRGCDGEYAESLGKRSGSVRESEGFIKATKSGGNRALNKSVPGAH
ncbi:hypothetical protein ANO14919_089230 [Xylariales sp. No.14919]|nr:hypothetical protein ANO14919_089230 [Xylariales sp. No.14919]